MPAPAKLLRATVISPVPLNAIFVNPTKKLSNIFSNIIEPQGFDGAVNGIGKSVDWSASKARLAQAGGTGFYLFAMVIGIVIIIGINFGGAILGLLKLK